MILGGLIVRKIMKHVYDFKSAGPLNGLGSAFLEVSSILSGANLGFAFAMFYYKYPTIGTIGLAFSILTAFPIMMDD